MISEIKTINLPLPYRMGSVNCYLLKTDDGGYILIDSGASNACRKLEEMLVRNGCKPGVLRLIIITHGDFDHTGNAAYLRKKFDSRIAMHRDDAKMASTGDMFFNRKTGNIVVKKLIRLLSPVIFGFGKSQRFQAELYFDDVIDLSAYIPDARIVHIPGHSRGSIGILTGNGDLFCGDIIINDDKTDQPKLNSIIDDRESARESIEKLRKLKIDTVYPGHGKPFTFDKFFKREVENK